MDPFTIGLGLAKLVPAVWDLFDGKDENKDIEKAEKLVQIAEKVTGHEGEHALSAIEQNPQLALQFKKQATEDKYFKEILDANDRKDARQMYQNTNNQQANDIAKRIMEYNIYFVVGIALAQILALAFVPEMTDTVKVIIGNVCGWVIKGLLDERLQVCNFFFGSSLGSKHKDK